MEKRRTVRKQTAAEVKAAVDLMAAAGGDVVSYEERYNSAIFTRRPADDEGFAALTPFTTLREIDATAARVTNDGLRHLANLRDLESLNLKGASAVDGRGLAHLKGLSRLRYLTLDATDVGDDGLEHLRDLPDLQFLSLAGTLVTGAGLAKLRDLPQLRTLYLGYTKVTQEAVDEFARSRPDVTVGLKVLPKDKGQRRRP